MNSSKYYGRRVLDALALALPEDVGLPPHDRSTNDFPTIRTEAGVGMPSGQ
jgi:hypothetical protein